jgi:hypothetical protein
MEIRDERFFIEATLERVQHLIRQGVWEGVDLARSRSWYQQFEHRECGLLGACLLDNLIYRSRAQLLALLGAVMTSPELLGPDDDDDRRVVNSLRSSNDPGIRLVPVIRLDQPPTKSGMYILRLLSREFAVRDRWMVWPQGLEAQPPFHTLLLVDDFCGSGDQFAEFLETPALRQLLAARPDCRVVYVAAAAHEQGMAKIRAAMPRIQVLAAEVLGTDHHFFNGTVLDQYGIDGLKEQLLAQYNTMCDAHGIGSGRIGPFGYQEQGLTYGFAHGTPNNSLPMLWQDANGWTPLLNR